MEHDVGAAHQCPPEGEGALVAGLGVHGVGGAHVRGPVRQAVAPCELAPEHGRLHVLGRAEGGGAGLHVDIGREPAVDDRRAAAHELGEGDPRQRLGVLLHHGAGDRDRRHRPGQGERGQDDDLVARRVLDDPLEHRRVEAQRRRHVDDGVDDRVAVEVFGAQAAADARHLQAVEVAHAAEAVDVEGLAGEGEDVAGGLQVADRRVDVGRLDRVAAVGLHDAEPLAELQQHAEVVSVAAAPPAPAVAAVGGACHGCEHHVVAAHGEVVAGIGCVHRELGWRGFDQVQHQARLDAHPLIVDSRAGGGPEPQRLRMQEVHACSAQHLKRRRVDRLELIVGDHPGRLEAAPVEPPRRLGRAGRRGLSPGAAAGSSGGLAGALGRLGHVCGVPWPALSESMSACTWGMK